MQYLKTPQDHLFRRRSRRSRLSAVIFALIGLTLWNVFSTNALARAGAGAGAEAGENDPAAAVTASAVTAFAVEQDAFDRLTEAPGLKTRRFGEDGPRAYRTVGGPERFTFVRQGREGILTFDCPPGARMCKGIKTGTQKLSVHPAAGGDTVFKSAGGLPVIRETATGGVTLLPGAPFVPITVPKGGRAVVEVE